MKVEIDTLRRLIVESAPEPGQARAVLSCSPDRRLDEVIPFSSLLVLGTIVALEHHYKVRVTREALARATTDGATLQSIAGLVAELSKADAG